MIELERMLHLAIRRVLEPAFLWVLDHPFVSVLCVVGLTVWAVRGYRML